ncbi:MAG: hypothetical protein U0W40_17475 [Acidimicrobiia bacterium]
MSPHATHDDTGAVAGLADATGRYLPSCAPIATKATDTVRGGMLAGIEEGRGLALHRFHGCGRRDCRAVLRR